MRILRPATSPIAYFLALFWSLNFYVNCMPGIGFAVYDILYAVIPPVLFMAVFARWLRRSGASVWWIRAELGLGAVWYAMFFAFYARRTFSRVVFGPSQEDMYFETPAFSGRLEDYDLIAVWKLVYASGMSGAAVAFLVWIAFRSAKSGPELGKI